MLKILLVKMSSMGDLVHNLPLVSDIIAHYPEAQIDWVAEQAYSPIPALHPGLRRVIPIAMRRWRQHLGKRDTWRAMRDFKAALQAESYDYIFDTQGLWKSLAIDKLAHGRIVGGDQGSIREGLAAYFYDMALPIAWSRHVIDRCRAVGAGALDYAIDTPPRFGIQAEPLKADWLPAQPYAVLMHAASRPEKLWAEANWVRLGQFLGQQGLAIILPWGSADEKVRAERLALQLPGAVVPPSMDLAQAGRFLAGAQLVVGLDTGFTHFAAALARPTVGIFCDSDSEQAAVYGDAFCKSLGGKAQPPAYELVQNAVAEALA